MRKAVFKTAGASSSPRRRFPSCMPRFAHVQPSICLAHLPSGASRQAAQVRMLGTSLFERRSIRASLPAVFHSEDLFYSLPKEQIALAHFTPFNRKAALLHVKFGGKGNRDGSRKPEGLGGLTLNAIRYWKRATEEYKDTKAISDALKSHLRISDSGDLLSDDVTVKKFSTYLGYTIQQGREIIDQAYSELYPSYSIFYSHPRLAKDIVERFGQFHLIYRLESGARVQDFTKLDENIVQIPLTVRYMLKGTKSSVDEQYRVRCKLNIPSYTAATSRFEYDGYVTPQKDNTHYWLFENRSEENKDLIFMITDTMQIIRHHHEETIKEHHFTQGIMLTRRQDAWPMHKIWKVVMLKIEPDDCAFFEPTNISDTESAFMASQCKVVPHTDVLPWIVDVLATEWNGLELPSRAAREAP